MNILVTIRAMLVRHRTLEIVVLVALDAGRIRVFAVERKLRIVVIKAHTRLILVPTGGVVARFARALKLRVLKRALMRISVAALAVRKRQSFVTRRFLAYLGLVAFLARHGLVQPSQRIRRSKVIKAARGLPGVLRMATHAFRPQLTGMYVLVTRGALAPQSQVRMI